MTLIGLKTENYLPSFHFPDEEVEPLNNCAVCKENLAFFLCKKPYKNINEDLDYWISKDMLSHVRTTDQVAEIGFNLFALNTINQKKQLKAKETVMT